MFVDGTINGAVNNGTIGRVGNINGFIAGSSETKRDLEKVRYILLARSREDQQK